jgi:hypothetical protein
VARINALQARDQRLGRLIVIASVILPGSAGLFAKRNWAVLVGTLSGALAITTLAWRNGVVPDPLLAGAAAPVAFGILATLAVTAYVITIATSLSERRRI